MDDDHEGGSVGYKRPPRHSRFRKGQSGNPRGRRKGSGKLSAAERVLERKVTATVDGQRQKVAITEALVLQLTQRALAGDVRATREVLKIADQLAAATPDPARKGPGIITMRFVDPMDCNPALEALGVIVPVGDRYKISPWAVEAAMARRPDLDSSDQILVHNSTLKPGERRHELTEPIDFGGTARPLVSGGGRSQ